MDPNSQTAQPEPSLTPSQPTPPQPLPVPMPTPVSTPTEWKRRLPKWILIAGGAIIGLVVLFIVIYFITSAAASAPKQISDTFVADLRANNSNAAYALTSDGFKQATTVKQLTDLFDRLSPLLQGSLGVTDRSINKKAGSLSTAIIEYSVATSNGSKYVRVVLQEAKTGWQVINLRSSDTHISVDDQS